MKVLRYFVSMACLPIATAALISCNSNQRSRADINADVLHRGDSDAPQVFTDVSDDASRSDIPDEDIAHDALEDTAGEDATTTPMAWPEPEPWVVPRHVDGSMQRCSEGECPPFLGGFRDTDVRDESPVRTVLFDGDARELWILKSNSLTNFSFATGGGFRVGPKPFVSFRTIAGCVGCETIDVAVAVSRGDGRFPAVDNAIFGVQSASGAAAWMLPTDDPLLNMVQTSPNTMVVSGEIGGAFGERAGFFNVDVASGAATLLAEQHDTRGYSRGLTEGMIAYGDAVWVNFLSEMQFVRRGMDHAGHIVVDALDSLTVVGRAHAYPLPVPGGWILSDERSIVQIRTESGETGEVVELFPIRGPITQHPPGVLYVTTVSTVSRIDVREDPPVTDWQFITSAREAPLLTADGVGLYTTAHSVVAIDLETGERLWALEIDVDLNTGPLLSDAGELIVVSYDGDVLMWQTSYSGVADTPGAVPRGNLMRTGQIDPVAGVGWVQD